MKSVSEGVKTIDWWLTVANEGITATRFHDTKCNSDVFKQDIRAWILVANDITLTVIESIIIIEVLIVTPFTLWMFIIPI